MLDGYERLTSLVGAAVLSTLVFPLLGLRLRRGAIEPPPVAVKVSAGAFDAAEAFFRQSVAV